MPFSANLKLLSANSFSLEESKICCLGKGGFDQSKMSYCKGLKTEGVANHYFFHFPTFSIY